MQYVINIYIQFIFVRLAVILRKKRETQQYWSNLYFKILLLNITAYLNDSSSCLCVWWNTDEISFPLKFRRIVVLVHNPDDHRWFRFITSVQCDDHEFIRSFFFSVQNLFRANVSSLWIYSKWDGVTIYSIW